MKRIQLISNNTDHNRAIKLLAKTTYKELVKNNFSSTDIVDFAKEIIDNLNLSRLDTITCQIKKAL